MKSKAQVVVIGGGVVGCSILYHLTSLGWRDVMLLEKTELTAGSTWHAAGNTATANSYPNLSRMQAYSVSLYKQLEAETGQNVGLNQVGGLFVATHPDRVDEFKVRVARARFLGLEYHLIGPAEAQKLFPLLNTHGVLAALYDPLDGFIDPSSLTNAFAIGARKNGAEIHRHCPVLGLSQRPDQSWDVSTPNGTVHAEYIVNAGGLWASEIATLVGDSLPIVPMQHQYVVTESIKEIEALDKPLPMMREVDSSYYMRGEGKGLLVGPYELPCQTWALDGIPKNFGQELFEPDLDRIETHLLAAANRVPVFGQAGIKQIVNGPISYTPDDRPLIGPMPGKPRFFAAAGFTYGIVMAGGAGLFIAKWLVNGEPDFDPMPFHPGRFGNFASTTYAAAKAREVYGYRHSIAYPHKEWPAGRPIRTTPAFERHKSRGAVFGAAYGWERPLWFADSGAPAADQPSFKRANWFAAVGNECASVRNGCGLNDLSTFAKYEISGPGATEALEYLFANSMPSKGRLALCPLLTHRGGILGDFTVTRLDDERFYLLSSAIAEVMHEDWFRQHLPRDVTIRSVSSSRAAFGIAGPRSRELLQSLTRSHVGGQQFPFMAAREMEVGPVRATVLRVSYTGELGFEFHFPMEQQLPLYDALFDAGQALGLKPFGSRALDSLRLEKGYRRWGADITPETDPYEAGMDRFVKLEKGGFIGRAALQKKCERGFRRKLVTLSIDAVDADAYADEPVYHAGKVVGVVTSGGYGYSVQRGVALAFVPPSLSDPGQKFEVEILGNLRPAEVVTDAIFDPKNERLRG